MPDYGDYNGGGRYTNSALGQVLTGASSALGNTPNRKTSEMTLDQWNQAFRASPIYQSFMQQHGLPTNGHVKLSRDQQAQLEQALRANGVNIPSGMHIDQGGNLNQKNRLGRNIAIGAAIGGGALTGLGLAGMGPLGGALGGAGGAGAASGLGASEFALSSAPYVGPAAGSLYAVPAGAAATLGTAAGAAGAAAAGGAGGGSGAGGAAGAGAAGAGGAADALGGGMKLGGMSIDDWLKIAAATTTAIGAGKQGGDITPTTQTQDPNITAILELMKNRLAASQPNFDSVQKMAQGRLPIQYQSQG